jgi:hypothetical protein
MALWADGLWAGSLWANGLWDEDSAPDQYLEIIPYLIGATEESARTMIGQIYMVASVTGSSGTVVSQNPAAFTTALRGATVSITLGGDINTPTEETSGGQTPYRLGIH